MQQNYSETIKNHYHHPRNAGKIANYTHSAEQINPLCGDEIRVYLKIENSKIENLAYEARGCMICVAAASVVSEYARGKKLKDLSALNLKDIEKLLFIVVSPARVNCATLLLTGINKPSLQHIP